jgi:Meiotically up-regulated gene 113
MTEPKQDQPVSNMGRTTLVTTHELAAILDRHPTSIGARASRGTLIRKGTTTRRSAGNSGGRRHTLYEVDGEDILRAETDAATAAAMIGISIGTIHTWEASGRLHPLRTEGATPIYDAEAVVKTAITCGYLPDLREQQDTYCCVSHCSEVAWRDEYIPVCWRHAIVVWLHVNDGWKTHAPPRQAVSSAGVHQPVVYFAQAGDRVKIGTTTNLPVRLKAIISYSGHDPQILLVVPGGRTEERQVHELFRKDRIRGEWFTMSPRLMEFIAERADLDVRHAAGHVDIT